MSAETRPNKLVLILAALITVVVIGLGLRSCTQPAAQRAVDTSQPSRPADADCVDATLKTMTARRGKVDDLGQRQSTQEQRLAQLESPKSPASSWKG